MGQYYRIVNLDAKETLNPHDFGSGLKLMELASGSNGVMQAVACLIAKGQPWFGQSLVVTGDYADEGRFVDPQFAEYNLYSVVSGYGKDGVDESEQPKAWPSANQAAYQSMKALGVFGGTDIQKECWGFEVDYRCVNGDEKYRALMDPKNWTKFKFQDFDDFLEFMQVQPTMHRRALASRLDTAFRYSALVTLSYRGKCEVKTPVAFEHTDIQYNAGPNTRVPLRVEGPNGAKQSVELEFPCTAQNVFNVFGIKAASVKKAIDELKAVAEKKALALVAS